MRMSESDDHKLTQEILRQNRKVVAEELRKLSPEELREFIEESSPAERTLIERALEENPE